MRQQYIGDMTGSIGGDEVTYGVYDNGSIYARQQKDSIQGIIMYVAVGDQIGHIL